MSDHEPFFTPDAWIIGAALATTALLGLLFYWAVLALPALVHAIGFLLLCWVALVTIAFLFKFLAGKPR
jgi:hypothetical protein